MRPSSKEVEYSETQLIRKNNRKKVTYLFVAKSIKATQPRGMKILSLWTLIQIFL